MGAVQQLRLMPSRDLAKLLSLMSQSMIAFTFNIGGLLSGLLIAYFFSKLQDPIILMLFPAILTLRGDVNGILSSKLGTLLHTGRIMPTLTENTGEFKTLLQSIFTFTFLDMCILGLFAFIVNFALGRAELSSLPLFMLIPTLTGGISVAISEAITAALTIHTFRRGLDPDILVYPIMSTVNDFTVTAIYFGVSWFMLSSGYPWYLSLPLFSGIMVASLTFTYLNHKMEMFRKIFKEATPVILICLSLGIFSGLILSGFKTELEMYPGILIVYPVLMGALGNLGAITGATTTTKLFLGELEAKISTVKEALRDLLPIEGAALILHIIYAVIGFMLSRGAGLIVQIKTLLIITLSSNLITAPIIFLLAYVIAMKTFQRGWDPDNFVVPLETSIADSLATVTLSILVVIIIS